MKRAAKTARRASVPILAALAVGAPTGAAAAPRAMIYVAMVTPADERAKTALLDWGSAFKFGLDPLITELSASDPAAVAPQIVLAPVSQAPSLATLKSLSDEGQAVEVSSAISQWTSTYSLISLTVYLGPLKGSLASPVLTLRQKVLAGRYQVDRDALALIALYAWGQASLGASPAANRTAACGYFARARLIGRQIAPAVPEVAPVLRATEQGLAQCRHV
jgi:hypothetical protein